MNRRIFLSMMSVLALSASVARAQQDDVGKPDPIVNLPAELPGPNVDAAAGVSAEAPNTSGDNAETPPPQVSPEDTPAPVQSETIPTPAEPAPRAARAAPAERNSDDPDLNRETNFHRIYEKYNSTPTPMEAWEQASSARQSEVYKVQKGDTLWDLSKTLFADPNYWPKVWSLNSDEVSNPHEIETWMQIRFFPGDLNEPPTVVVAEAAPAPKKGEDDVALPPPRKRPLVIRKLPDSMPQYRVEAVVGAPEFQSVAPRPPIMAPDIVLGYKISETPVNGVGEIKETELGLQTASEFQYVFVTGGESADRIYTVVKEVGQIRDPRVPKEQARVGRMIEVQGEIEIVEAVNASTGLRRAIVRRNISPIEVGAKLVPGRIEMVSTVDGDPVPGPQTRIIGSAFNDDRRLTDPGGLIFLDGGRSVGLQEGMILPVQSNVRARVPLTGALVNDRLIGHARIVRVTDNFATAVLVRVNEDIIVGDTVGGAGQAAALPMPHLNHENHGSSAAPESDLDFGDDESGPGVNPADPLTPSTLPPAPEEPARGEGDDEELTL